MTFIVNKRTGEFLMLWSRIRQVLFLSLAIAGFIWPVYYLVQFITEINGGFTSSELQAFDLPLFVSQVWVNSASSFVAADLAIVLVLGLTFIVTEGRRLQLKFWGIYIALTFIISYAFGFSLFMFIRERKLAESLEPAEAEA
ncbi:MAG: DUF2834 domain-containing protein [Cyanobacteria bacterium P01_F01_bin.153]